MNFTHKLQTFNTALYKMIFATGLALSLGMTPAIAGAPGYYDVEECSEGDLCYALAACATEDAIGTNVIVTLEGDHNLSGPVYIYADRCDVQVQNGTLNIEYAKILGGLRRDEAPAFRQLFFRGKPGTTLNFDQVGMHHFNLIEFLNMGGTPELNINKSFITANKIVIKNMNAIITNSLTIGRLVTTGNTQGHRVDIINDETLFPVLPAFLVPVN